MQLLGREKRSPVSVKTADGGEVLFDPGSGQWLQPPGAQGSGIAKQDHERLKGITGHIGKAMGKDGMAYAIYHGEDGKAYGVPIGPAENYANIQPAAGQPAAAR